PRLHRRCRNHGGRRRWGLPGKRRAGADRARCALREPARHGEPAVFQPRGRGERAASHLYLAGQTGVDASGKVAEGFRAQALQVFENVRTVLAEVGGGFENVVKLNSYLTNIEANARSFARYTAPISQTSRRCPPPPWCRCRAFLTRPFFLR